MARMTPAQKAAAVSRLRYSFKQAQKFAKKYGYTGPTRFNSSLHPNTLKSRLHAYRMRIQNAKSRYQNEKRAEKARKQQEQEAARQAAIRAKEAAEKQRAIDEWNAGFSNAQNSARANADAYFQKFDLNPNDYADAIQRAIDETSGGYAVGSDYSGAFEGIGQRVFDNESAAHRDRALFDVNKFFRPNIGYEYINDQVDDSAIADILSSQYANAESAAQRARNRKQLTGSGYNAALEDLGKQRTQAESVLTGLGGDLLSSGRASLEGIGNEAREGAASLNLGQSFDLNPYQDRLQNSLNDFLGSLQGNLSSQAGELFDTGAALSAGNIAQGAQNLGQEKKPKGIFTGVDDDDDDPNLNRQSPVNSIF